MLRTWCQPSQSWPTATGPKIGTKSTLEYRWSAVASETAEKPRRNYLEGQDCALPHRRPIRRRLPAVVAIAVIVAIDDVVVVVVGGGGGGGGGGGEGEADGRKHHSVDRKRLPRDCINRWAVEFRILRIEIQ